MVYDIKCYPTFERISTMRAIALLYLTAMAGAGLAHAQTQEFPRKPLRMVAAEAGGGGDFAARLIAAALSENIGQQVIVDNRGGPIINATQAVIKATPDGYTLLLHGGTVWTFPLLRNQAPYDAVRDFAPVTWAIKSTGVLVVHPSVTANSVRDLIAMAKTSAGQLNYASGPSGSENHLWCELFRNMAGINLVRIPYKGAGPAINALLGGQVQLMVATSGSSAPHIKSGKLKALAVTSAQPSALLPGLPTIASSGLAGYEAETIIGLLAPAGTPRSLIDRLNQESVRVLRNAGVKEKFLAAGVETVGSSPEVFSGKIKSEIAKWEKLIKESGIQED